MSELEMEIGRMLGASAFFVYQTIKANPNSSVIELVVETGLSQNCVQSTLDRLAEVKAVERFKEVRGSVRLYRYKQNDAKETWKLH